MGVTQIMRRFEFDAAHRVLGHQGKCRFLHGHRYVAEVTVQAEKLNSLGMVVDFSVIKEVIGGWIESQWDHNILLNRNDPLYPLFRDHQSINHGKLPYVNVLSGENPTAEYIAKWLFRISESLLFDKCETLRVVHVRVWETPNTYADYIEE